ncbi:3'-5' exonuclease [Phenylobacterium sp.]|uniref:3'-5' exonuclease n=1 Tax=Phenylobacterium sp. TaxID=1871053 RepID=UPI00301E1EF3
MSHDPLHIMVDLETFGTTPGAAIASIGAVAFDPRTGVIGPTFYRVVDLGSCAAAGLTFEPSTITWWLRQSEAAREALTEAQACELGHALGWFRMFYIQNCRGRPIWGHGANFDEPILSAAFRAVGVAIPWSYWDARCTRTLFAMAKVKPDRAAGTHHNALDDALAQAHAAIAAYRALGLADATDAAPAPDPAPAEAGRP